mmetsp:Transcript_48745/g.96536  ORF Transcript_48745/g.96536 Transcript_48745/m.96536 type:complete len:211 (-) Transcript_48745:30-662(-)
MSHRACSTRRTSCCSMPEMDDGSTAKISFQRARGMGLLTGEAGRRKSGSTRARASKKSWRPRNSACIARASETMKACSASGAPPSTSGRHLTQVSMKADLNKSEVVIWSSFALAGRRMPSWCMMLCFSHKACMEDFTRSTSEGSTKVIRAWRRSESKAAHLRCTSSFGGTKRCRPFGGMSSKPTAALRTGRTNAPANQQGLRTPLDNGPL